MSRIGDGDHSGGPSGTADSEPWPEEAESRVRSLRSAITANLEGEPVDTDVAPLLPDLLTRLDAVSASEPSSDLDGPVPPDAVSPPSPSDEMFLLRRVESKLEEATARLDGDEKRAVRGLAETLGRYRSLREQVLIRSEL